MLLSSLAVDPVSGGLGEEEGASGEAVGGGDGCWSDGLVVPGVTVSKALPSGDPPTTECGVTGREYGANLWTPEARAAALSEWECGWGPRPAAALYAAWLKKGCCDASARVLKASRLGEWCAAPNSDSGCPGPRRGWPPPPPG